MLLALGGVYDYHIIVFSNGSYVLATNRSKGNDGRDIRKEIRIVKGRRHASEYEWFEYCKIFFLLYMKHLRYRLH